ncbi:MAG: glycosyltransferase, partial [Lentisphaerae bacterium]|nr:glycosyltransferase [Lentisphaerota bacterium]
MHLCFVTYDTPNRLGGPLVNIRRLLPELTKRGHRVSALVLYWQRQSSLVSDLEAAGVNCRVAPQPRYTTDAIRWILKQVRALRPDVFVANTLVVAFFGSRWIRAAGIPTVATLRCADAFH